MITLAQGIIYVKFSSYPKVLSVPEPFKYFPIVITRVYKVNVFLVLIIHVNIVGTGRKTSNS